MQLDPVTVEVTRQPAGRHRRRDGADPPASAYSPIVKEGLDASAALFTIQGETLAQAVAIPIHLGTLAPAVRRIIQEFPPAAMHPTMSIS